MDLRKKVEDVFADYQKDLGRLVSIGSVLTDDGVKPFGKNVQLALEEVLKISKELGFTTYIDPDGYYGYAEIGTGGEMFGVLGHMDVVPPGSLDSWETNPFELVEKDGFLIGRGSSDDKGPTLAAMYALKILLDEGKKLNQRVRFIFGTDEESLWRCMKAYVAKEELPTKGFTPDSGFPLIYAEKGLIEYTLTSHEMSDVRLEGGGALNAVPAQATTDFDEAVAKALDELGYEYTVNGKDLTVIGLAIHAKDSDRGKNAIVYLAEALHKAGKTNDMIRFIVEKMSNPNGTLIYGEVSDEVSGKLMFNVGKAEFRENMQEIGIDIRFPVTFPVETVEEKLKAEAHKYEVVVERFDYLKSIYMEKDSPYIKQLMKAYQDVTGDLESQPITSGGATYARAMDNVVAFGALLPTGLKTEHQPNERISIADMKVAMTVYAEAFLNIVVG
ncbi:Sapep family Mn(2+)-dependent dipeptidase [Erysipelothrix sp. HDW6C]|uniref:Sapep family Mn(2+)-dependent dipeptidase n=1 Tax=Erysipelothrix sp. HDW6C TaxID=2714930 RepID=UPI00140E1EC5|nr:Sapep family Mn(2+)-dependent dipeptidase [Erysipelothrix sp. HDW6C]QIK69515.1 Sapep family Mn(2+)-dependent dipeptidase [Erysipelothrix sp. HDW6C]